MDLKKITFLIITLILIVSVNTVFAQETRPQGVDDILGYLGTSSWTEAYTENFDEAIFYRDGYNYNPDFPDTIASANALRQSDIPTEGLAITYFRPDPENYENLFLIKSVSYYLNNEIAEYDVEDDREMRGSMTAFPKDNTIENTPLELSYDHPWNEPFHIITYDYRLIDPEANPPLYKVSAKTLSTADGIVNHRFEYTYNEENFLTKIEKFGKTEFNDRMEMKAYIELGYNEGETLISNYTLFDQSENPVFSFYLSVDTTASEIITSINSNAELTPVGLYVRYLSGGFLSFFGIVYAGENDGDDDIIYIYNDNLTFLRSGDIREQ